MEIQPENLNYVGCQIRGHSSVVFCLGETMSLIKYKAVYKWKRIC